MKLRLTAVAMALSVLVVGPVYAGGAGGDCNYGGQYQQTSIEPLEQSDAAKKLASLSEPATDQEVASQAAAVSAPNKADASTSQAAAKTTTQ